MPGVSASRAEDAIASRVDFVRVSKHAATQPQPLYYVVTNSGDRSEVTMFEMVLNSGAAIKIFACFAGLALLILAIFVGKALLVAAEKCPENVKLTIEGRFGKVPSPKIDPFCGSGGSSNG